ncbi:MAG: hypothetical protein IJY93_10045 [Clostridia bacterium]|nr:hypothetical protein [Clostridia bacterium]
MQNQNNSIMAVFEAVSEAGELSRARISDITGFSLVTVGKVVDLLCECGIVTEYKQTSGTVGRKSGICKLINSSGMLIFDLTGEPKARLYDISLSLCDEYTGDSVCDMMARGLMRFGELLGGELMGIGCIVPDGETELCASQISDAIGVSPEIITVSSRAYAVANAKRFHYNGMAVFLRLLDGIDGAIMYGGRLYTGAHGGAGDISAFIPSRDVLYPKLTELCYMLDPGMIHISCKSDDECKAVETELTSHLQGSLGERTPLIVTEPSALCRSASDGAALMLREKYLLSKTSR